SPVADPFTFLVEVNFAGGRGGSPSVFPNVCNGVKTGGSGGGSAYTNANGGAGQTSSACSIAQGGNGYGKGGNNQTNTAGQNGTAPGGGGGSSIGGSLTTTGAGAPGQVRITYWCAVNEVGVIGNPHTVVNPQELVPDLVSSVQPAVVMSGTPPYGWEEQLNGSTVWNDIPGATGSSYSIPNINQTRTYRRYTEVCNLGRSYTNEVVIKVMTPNGNISGKVLSANEVGVEGIEIQIRKKTDLPGSPKEFVYSTTTGPDGAYLIPVYFGDPNEGNNNGTVSTDFVIRPIKLNHDFAPDSLIRSVSTTNINRDDVHFTDNTAFSITGKVYQQCIGCLDQNDQPVTVSSNLDGVTILRKGNFVMKSSYLNPPGLYGQWASTVTDQGIYSFKPTLEGHRFLPDSLNVTVLNNVAGIDFEDTTQYTISGRFGDGCNNYIGIAELEFSDILLDKDGNERPSEFRKRIFTNDDGTYSVRLPARKYRVSVIGFSLASSSETVEETDLLAFFNNAPLPSALSADSLLTDISSGNQQLNLRYQRPPSMQLIGFDNSLCDNGSPLPYVTLRQSDKKIIQVKVFQGSVGLGCPLSDDTVRIVTNLAGDDQNESFFMLPVGGVAKDSLKVGSPNILGNFRKVFNVDYTDSYGRKATQVKPEIVVLGVKSDNASSFATTSPQIPLIVLHDPPGDQSYSYWETNKTIERAMRWSAASGNNVEGWLNIKVGAQFEAGLGVTTETQIWGSINSSVAVNSRTNNAEESIVSTTTTQNISTSADQDVTGDDGDLFIGAAMNLLYTRSTQVLLDENCQLVAPKRLMIAQNGFATQYVYTASAIRDNVIPTLQNFVNNPGNTESETRNYLNQIKVWEQVLANNELNKGRSALDKNISFFGSSGPISNSTTTTATKTNTIEFDMEIDAGLALELGFEIAGSGLSGGVNVHMKTEMGNSTTNTTTNSTTIGYTLDDNDALDNFSVNVRKDPVYNTPVFQTVAGQSSCPPESNTQPRDEIQLTVQNPVLTDVPASSDAIFEMKLGNLSIDPNPRTYNLSFEQASNPFGATISIGG
ncbi:MAG TPA: hypothetical protein PLK63_15945, partial [Catalimonadaceae bacterium]|nr:hypothetical protein [Catalimonadaceae bacterium]